MNYERIYSELIFRAKNRSILEDQYTEKHHILPKSMYPEFKKEKWNLVKLFPEEHLVAHLLLVKIYKNHKMVHAVNRMTNTGKFNNKKYSWIRNKHTDAVSKRFKGRIPWNKGLKDAQEINGMKDKNHSYYSKNKISITKTGVKHKTKKCYYCGNNIGVNNFNRYHGENCKMKSGNENLHKKILTEELRGKMSESMKEACKKRVLVSVECPHCGKIGRGPNMTRYHFDKC